MSLFAEWYSDVVRTPERDAAHQLRGEERWGEVGRDRERDRERERDTERDRETERESLTDSYIVTFENTKQDENRG